MRILKTITFILYGSANAAAIVIPFAYQQWYVLTAAFLLVIVNIAYGKKICDWAFTIFED